MSGIQMEKDYIKRLEVFEILDVEELEVIEAALLSLEQYDNPLRLSNFTLGIRTFLDWFMKKEAPDESVMECDWYKARELKCGCVSCQENVKVETVQKLKYIIVKSLDNSMYNKIFAEGNEVEESIKKLRKIYSKLNAYIHFTPSNFKPTDKKVNKLVDKVFDLLENYFLELESALEYAHDYLKEYILQDVVEYFLSDRTISDLDILATRYYVENFYLEDPSDMEFSISSNLFNEKIVDGTGTGIIEVTHHYGGTKDLSEGYYCSYPVTFNYTVKLADFGSVEVTNYEVDTSSFDRVEGLE